MADRQETDAAIKSLLDAGEMRRQRMLRVADFATFFGNVMPTHPESCNEQALTPTMPGVPLRPLLALRRPLRTELGQLSMVEYRVQSRSDGTVIRQTDLVYFNSTLKVPADIWKADGQALVTHVPHTNMTSKSVHHQLETLYIGPISEDSVLERVVFLTNSVLEASGIEPYPGYQEQA